eukprot:SAG22_NODE_2184_length_2871_cov_10.209235_1_plen_691_part_00
MEEDDIETMQKKIKEYQAKIDVKMKMAMQVGGASVAPSGSPPSTPTSTPPKCKVEVGKFYKFSPDVKRGPPKDAKGKTITEVKVIKVSKKGDKVSYLPKGAPKGTLAKSTTPDRLVPRDGKPEKKVVDEDSGDKTPEKEEKSAVKESNIQFLHGDCFHHMSLLPDDSIDVIVTSPPYNIGKDYDQHGDNDDPQEFLRKMRELSALCKKVLKPDGHFFLNVGANNVAPWKAWDVAGQFRDLFELQNDIVWVKNIHIDGQNYGNPRFYKTERFLNHTHEMVFHFTHDGHQPIARASEGLGVPNFERGGLRCRGNTWYVNHQGGSRANRGGHPAPNPQELSDFCLLMSGKTSGVVLDPFVGSGTTMRSAQKLGLDGIGIDISQQYLDFATQSVATNAAIPPKKTPQKKVPIKAGKMDLFCGDSLDKLKGMDTDSVDVVVTSPPYNLGIKYDVYDDSKTDEEYLSWINEIASELRRVVKPDGSVFVNVGFSNTKPLVAMQVAQHFCQHFVMQNQFVWVKSIAIKGETTGNFKPINSSRYVNNTHEFIYHFTADGAQDVDKQSIGVPYTHKGNLKRFDHDVDVRCRGNCWFVPYEPINSKEQRGNHPATFPAAIPEMCIHLSGKKTGVVLDPFVGTGTTAIVASNLGFDAIGIDMLNLFQVRIVCYILRCLLNCAVIVRIIYTGDCSECWHPVLV